MVRELLLDLWVLALMELSLKVHLLLDEPRGKYVFLLLEGATSALNREDAVLIKALRVCLQLTCVTLSVEGIAE